VRRVKTGDIVCLPFNMACGYCKNCERGYTGFCLTMNPGNAGAAYGYAEMGPYQVAKPSSCVFLTPTSTAWFCQKARRTKKTIT
jgi:threonine dehydrogenase-like Zn-dependent dehydrogenase